MTTRRHLLLLSLVTTTGVLVFAYWQFWPRTAITLENSRKIELGMTLEQVEAILGGPARNESTWDDDEKIECQENAVLFAMPRQLWITDDVVIAVTFEEDLVFWSQATVVGRQREPFTEAIHRWMHLN